MEAERYFPVMGTTAHILVLGAGAPSLLEWGVSRLGELERKWSRFIPSSEISRANAVAGSHVVVSPETLLLVQRAVEGWSATGGSFDPTVLPAVVNAGYDRDFASVAAAAASLRPAEAERSPGCDGIVCDARIGTITLPRGVTFDPGGIGKGLAADLVSEELIERGAHGALVNVGGDLRVRGEPPNGASWDVALDHPGRPGLEMLRVGLLDGAVATTSRARRTWQTAVGPAHHLIDPGTGRPAASRHLAVSVVATDSWWAEVVAKAIFVDELGVDAGARFGARVVTVDDTGAVEVDPALLGVAA
jgi:FAD:protein FMN transferase